MLHYVYKFFSDGHLWDDFDYYVLRIQLLCNIITILIALVLWSADLNNQLNTPTNAANPIYLLGSTGDNEDHTRYWCPIILLAISLGTVYAFYPSIAPYSIIDFQYASVIELWILILSGITPLVFAILDYMNYGPSATKGTVQSISTSSITVASGVTVNLLSNNPLTLSDIQVKHTEMTGTTNQVKHPLGKTCEASVSHETCNGDPKWHECDKSGGIYTYQYTLQTGDKYKYGTGGEYTGYAVKSGVISAATGMTAQIGTLAKGKYVTNEGAVNETAVDEANNLAGANENSNTGLKLKLMIFQH